MGESEQLPRKRRRRPNYHLRRICALLILAAILTGIVFAGISCCRFLNRHHTKGPFTEISMGSYPTETPQDYTVSQALTHLEDLAAEYPEFQEIIDNADAYPDDMITALANNPNMLDFARGYPTAEKKAIGGLTKSECKEAFPLFLQWDPRWGYVPYGDENIGLSGCGPTCVAMAAFALTRDENITPDKTAKAATEGGYHQAGVGTKWSFMTEGALEFGITADTLPLEKSTVIAKLEEGCPIICSMAPGDFTAHGHFILMVGAENGKIRINDPNSAERSNQLWEFDDIADQIKNLWCYTRS